MPDFFHNVFQFNIDYRGAAGVPISKWKPGATFDMSHNGGSPSTGAGSDGSDRESVKSSRSSRSENLMRSSSLNRAMGNYSYDRL